MKQFAFVIEVLIKDDNEILLLRNPQTGIVVNVFDSPANLTSELVDAIVKFKNYSKDGK